MTSGGPANSSKIYNLENGIFGWHNESRPLVVNSNATDYVHPYNFVWGRMVNRKDLKRYKRDHIERASKLVTGGLYRISRNPMYLGLALILSGVAILLGNPINLIALALFIWGMNILQIRPEEALLSDKFGSQYYLYSQRVRRADINI